MSDGNLETITRFYGAFSRRDGEAMAACYAPDAHFRDPAFGDLHGEQVGDMWRMLTASGRDLEVELHDPQASGDTGSARWIARYTFSMTGRRVVNDVQASFTFGEDHRIRDHVDRFSYHRWARQALGTPGLLLGWTPLLPAKTRRTAHERLAAFSAQRRAPAG